MYHKRIYKPMFPQKYEGDPTNIVMRSSWETRFAKWCDVNPSVVKWCSEETVIPYRCPTDGRLHRYFVDFKVKIKDAEGKLKVYLVEVKPDAQTRPPLYPGRQTKRYLTESLTFMKNQAKWEAAERYCRDRGYQFIILTENHLGLK